MSALERDSRPASSSPSCEELRILLIEDDAEIAQSVAYALCDAGHAVVVRHTAEAGLSEGLARRYDAVIVDRLLADADGLTVIRRLRDGGLTYPALVLTALGGVQDRIDGLDAGADDYLIKPFAISELLARIRAITRRAAQAAAPTQLSAGPILMDLLARRVTRDGATIYLQPREFRLLEELLRNAGHYVSRAMLLERVWNMHFEPGTKIIETHMSRVRAKLNVHGDDMIETTRGLGYRIRTDAPNA